MSLKDFFLKANRLKRETPEEKWRDTAVSWKDSAKLHSDHRTALAERLRLTVRNHRKGRTGKRTAA